jgi:hypothetical protein
MIGSSVSAHMILTGRYSGLSNIIASYFDFDAPWKQVYVAGLAAGAAETARSAVQRGNTKLSGRTYGRYF